MLRMNVEFDDLGLDAAAALFGAYHVFEPLILFLQEDPGFFDFLFLDFGGEGGVEVGLGTLVEEVFIPAVFLQDEENFVLDVHVVEEGHSVLFLLQQLVQVLEGGLLHDGFVQTLHAAVEAAVVVLLVLLQFKEDLLEFVVAGSDAGLELVELFVVDGALLDDLFLELEVVLQDDVGPPLEGVDGLLLVLQDLPHFGLVFFHVLADLVERLLLPFDEVEAEFEYFSEVGAEVLPELLLVALDPVVGKGVLLDQLVLPLVVQVALQLLLQLVHQLPLDLVRLLARLQLLRTHALAPVVEEPIV